MTENIANVEASRCPVQVQFEVQDMGDITRSFPRPATIRRQLRSASATAWEAAGALGPSGMDFWQMDLSSLVGVWTGLAVTKKKVTFLASPLK